MILNNMHQISF